MKNFIFAVLAFHLFFAAQANGQPPRKKFFFSAVVTPQFDATVPPVSLLFEKGIAKVASAGLDVGLSYDNSLADYESAAVVVGARACGYVMPIISLAAKKKIASFGFDPYAGLLLNYYVSTYSYHGNTSDPFTDFKPGAVIGTRWYPGDKRAFALLVEYCTTGIYGGDVRFGITFGR